MAGTVAGGRGVSWAVPTAGAASSAQESPRSAAARTRDEQPAASSGRCSPLTCARQSTTARSAPAAGRPWSASRLRALRVARPGNRASALERPHHGRLPLPRPKAATPVSPRLAACRTEKVYTRA